jgi:hypothetical protein
VRAAARERAAAQPGSLDIVLVTGRRMEKPDPETPRLLGALRSRGVRAEIVPWGPGFDWARASRVVVRSTWDYVHLLPEFLAWAGAVTGLVNPLDVIRWGSSKRYLLQLDAAGVPVVPTVLVPRGAPAEERDAALAGHQGEVVVKPAVSSGALATARGPAGRLRDHLRELTRRDDVLVQPLMRSVLDRGEVSLMYFEGEFSHAVRKLPAPGDFRVQTQHGGHEVPYTATLAEREVATAALAQVPALPTYARVDLVDLDRPRVMELELIEPELFLRYDPGSVPQLADALVRLL